MKNLFWSDSYGQILALTFSTYKHLLRNNLFVSYYISYLNARNIKNVTSRNTVQLDTFPGLRTPPRPIPAPTPTRPNLGENTVNAGQMQNQVTAVVNDIWTASRVNDVNYLQNRIKELGLFQTIYKLVNATDQDGFTPLFIAAANENMRTMELLVNNKADTSMLDRRGYTVLHYAVEREKENAVKFLLERGFRVDSRGKCGYTPCHLAFRARKFAMVDILVAGGADINAKLSTRSVKNTTMLHCAVIDKDIPSVEHLLSIESLDPSIVDANGCTAVSLALTLKLDEIVKLILNSPQWLNTCLQNEGKNNWFELLQANENGNPEITKLIDDKFFEGASLGWKRNKNMVQVFPSNPSRETITPNHRVVLTKW